LEELLETAPPVSDSDLLSTDLQKSSQEDAVSISKAALKHALSEQKNFEASVTAKEAAHIRYEEMLRILASFGISISVFAHEVGGALTGVDGALLAISKQSKPDENSESWALVEDNMQRLRDLSGYISEMISHAGSRERCPIPLSAVISTFIREFSNYLNSKNIKFSHSVEPAFLRTAPMHRSEIDSVLFNFLTNAVKAVGRSRNTDRRISITAYKREAKAIIRFQDSGDGVPENIKEQIFDPFFTTSMYDSDVTAGTGTGLGLKIVHDIASANGGWVSLSDPDPGFGCCFEFAVPLSSGQQQGA
jgi:signal transduction histidine kinase